MKMQNHTDQQQSVILLARSAVTAPENVNAQVTALKTFALHRGLEVIDILELDGVCGSPSGVGVAINRLIERGQEQADFSVVLVTEISRLGRMGAFQMHSILHLLAEAGVTVVTLDNSGTHSASEVFRIGKEGVDEPPCER